MSKQSLLILSLDGASWEGFAPWLEQGRMPTLRGLMESGSSGTLQAVLPLFVYPNWASFWTGENPGQHTIFAFATLGETSVVGPLVDSRTLKRPTWLQLVSDHGLRVVSIYAQLTYPPQPLNGYVVSELHMREANNFTHPPDLAQELRSRFRPLLVPKSEQYFPSGGLRSTDDVHEFVQKQIQSIVQTKDVARYVLGKSPWDVGVIHFFATDPLQHALWHGVDPRHPRFDSKVHREVGEFFSALDAAMGDLIEATNPEAVVVLSLHGFTTTSKILNLSRFLGEVGILKPLSFPRRLIRKSMRIRGVGRLAKMIPRVRQIFKRPPWKPRNVFLDHKAIYVHKTEGNSKEITNTLVSALESLEDPENGCRVLRKAWRAEELYGTVELPGWDVLVLEFAEGYTGRNGDLNRPIFWSCNPNQDYLVGTHTQTGSWVFSGRGIVPNPGLHASVLDLPPTLLNYLGISIPKWMEGKALPILHSNRAS